MVRLVRGPATAQEVRKQPMSDRLKWLRRTLAAVALLLVAAGLFAMAHYNDDARTQGWQFDVGIGVVRYGVWLLLALGVATVLTALSRR